MSRRHHSQHAVWFAATVSFLVISFQVAGKAVRDALFLSTYDISALPMMLIAGSAVSIGLMFFSSRLLARFTPNRLMPWVFGTSSFLLLVEWLLLDAQPGLIAVAVYLHVTGLGGILVSGFWSVINEHFDPRTARRRMSQIAGGGTLGGVLGGLLAASVGGAVGISQIFPLLLLIHAVCAVLILRLTPLPRAGEVESTEGTRPVQTSGLQLLGQVSYLRNLGLLVFLGTLAAAFLDYVFKAQSVQMFAAGEELMRFFALFYTATAILTFLTQALFSKGFLERLGLGATVGLLPAVLAAGSVGALIVPGLVAVGLARGVESIVRGSLFRSAYELFYTPLQPDQKRRTKTLIDVGCDRLADIMGGATILLLLVFFPAGGVSGFLLLIALGVAGVALLVAWRLQAGYVASLEESLLQQKVSLDPDQVEDRTTRLTLMQTMLVKGSLLEPQVTQPQPAPPTAPEPVDPTVQLLKKLQSGDVARVTATLAEQQALESIVVDEVIRLLGWDAVCRAATDALVRSPETAEPKLIQSLLQPSTEFTIRRRIPRVLSYRYTPEVMDGLIRGLRDRRFEVRVRCGLALSRLQSKNPNLEFEFERILEVLLGEVAVAETVWESHRLLDELEEDEKSPIVDDLIRTRSSRGLEHVFTVLSLVLPRQPLRVAFMGLHVDDENLRGTALEYLESTLPDPLRAKLWPFLEIKEKQARSVRSREEILDNLMRSHQSIAVRLQDLNRNPED